MALLFCEGFEPASSIALKGWQYSPWARDNYPGGLYSGGRLTTYAYQSGSGGYAQGQGSSYKTIITSGVSTIIVGLAYYLPSASGASGVLILGLMNGSSVQIGLHYNGQYGIDIYRGYYPYVGAGATLGSTSGKALSLGWNYIEVKSYQHSSAGTVVVRINGQEVVSLSSKNTGSSLFTGIGLGGNQSSQGELSLWDDIYVCDTSGSLNNDFLGDIKIETVVPDGSGAVTQWTPSAGSNYQTIDELSSTWPNGDTDYNSSLTVGNQDTFTLGNLATTSGSVKALQYLLYARKTDAGTRAVRGIVRPSSTISYTGPSTYLATSYGYSRDVLETNPEDSQPWEIADVNGAQFGYELTV